LTLAVCRDAARRVARFCQRKPSYLFEGPAADTVLTEGEKFKVETYLCTKYEDSGFQRYEGRHET